MEGKKRHPQALTSLKRFHYYFSYRQNSVEQDIGENIREHLLLVIRRYWNLYRITFFRIAETQSEFFLR